MRLYVASSWRNDHQQDVVALLRAVGHEVYDFMHPPGGDHLGFSWSEIDTGWRYWTVDQYLAGIAHPTAVAGFDSDFGAMHWADAGVLVLPCGRSAHLEAGYFVGAGKPLVILLDPGEFSRGRATGNVNPELMYRMATVICRTPAELVGSLPAAVPA